MWKRITETKPPENHIINTKIDEKDGVRNEQRLTFDGKLWWTPDNKMYVYCTPTHWKY